MTEENRNDDNSTDEVETSTDGNGPQTAEHMDELTDVAVGDDAISRFPEEVQAALADGKVDANEAWAIDRAVDVAIEKLCALRSELKEMAEPRLAKA